MACQADVKIIKKLVSLYKINENKCDFNTSTKLKRLRYYNEIKIRNKTVTIIGTKS